MRIAALPVLAACAALAACAGQPNEVSSSPPTVSYQIPGNNAAATNAEAQNHCAQYGRGAQYRGTQATEAGEVAVYSCDGPTASSMSAAPVPLSGSTLPPGAAAAPPLCADALHEDRPGGTDYDGPPVAGCPPTR